MMIANAPQHLMLHELLEHKGAPLWLYFPQEVENSGWYIFHGPHKNNVFLEFSDGLSLMNFSYQTTWFAYDHVPKQLQVNQKHPAESGLSIELPCPLGSEIYTVECENEEHRSYKDYYDAPLSSRIKQAVYRRRRKKPNLYVKKHTVDAFIVYHSYGLPDVPKPFKYGLDRPIPICGYDGEWYSSENEAKDALSKLERENNA